MSHIGEAIAATVRERWGGDVKVFSRLNSPPGAQFESIVFEISFNQGLKRIHVWRPVTCCDYHYNRSREQAIEAIDVAMQVMELGDNFLKHVEPDQEIT